MYLESGYKTITPIQLCNALAALETGDISFRAFRVYLASFSLVAIREAAGRVRRKSGRRGEVTPRFRVEELARLTAISLAGHPLAIEEVSALRVNVDLVKDWMNTARVGALFGKRNQQGRDV